MTVKITKRITVVIDAEFGCDPTDEWGKDRNAYTASNTGHENILGAIADGRIVSDRKVAYVELGGGDCVEGKLVSIEAADVSAQDSTSL